MRSTEYGCANMITNRIHISAPDYQNDRILGILKVLVKHFVCPRGVPLGGYRTKIIRSSCYIIGAPLEIT